MKHMILEITFYTLYLNEIDSKNTHGTGILIKKELKPKFEKQSSRICTAEIELKHCKLTFISVYAHTSEKAEKNPEIREDFYEILEGTIDKIPKRDEVILAGDFNAKTGSGYSIFKENMGKYGKGLINNSGRRLLEMCKKMDLLITNTTFNHKLGHRTTWTAPYREFVTWNGENRKNPVRNQIDYIISRRKSRQFITNSRSYGGTETDSDHKLVKMEMKIEWSKIKKENRKINKIDVKGFVDTNKQQRYKEVVQEATIEMENRTSCQEKWYQICKIVKGKGKEILGNHTNSKKVNDPDLEQLTKDKHKTRKDIEASSNQEVRKEKQEKLKETKKKIKKRMKEVETQQIETKLAAIEGMKNDSTRYFAALKEMKNNKKKGNIVVKDENGKSVATEEQQIKIISQYFKKMLAPESSKENYITYIPQALRNPVTAEEIEKAAKKLKNGKSTGPDNIELELIKYSPIEIHREIANIFNIVAKTGENVTELALGLLRPLQKPGKTKGPTENLRPIILLSVLRKIMTICLIERTWERLNKHIPPDQAAYQPGRGTTEQVCAIKLLAEKAIVSDDYTIHLLLLDMSKAFDTVNRKVLFEELQEVLEDDEMHLISILTNKPKIQVKIGNSIGDTFETFKGIMQGDVLSAILFIFYLAKALKNPIKTKMKGFLCKPKYADDITYAGTSKHQIDELKTKVTQRLDKHDLIVNESKTERYQIPKPPPPAPPKPKYETLLKHKNDKILWSELDWLVNYKVPVKDKTPDWKNCKLLGSKLDTEKDIERRKGLTIDSMREMEYIYKSKSMSIYTKIRTFNAFAGSVFLYNSELWTISTTLEKKIDSFHRRMLRQGINVRWPKKISNINLYEKTKTEPWSKTIKRRRLNWIGHVMRLQEDTPVQIALKETLQPTKKKIGKPHLTWIKVIEKDLNQTINLDINNNSAEETIEKLRSVTMDRKKWKAEVKNIMESNL